MQLMERETLDKAEVAQIFEPLRRRKVRPPWTGSKTRVPSKVPPVEGAPRPSTNGHAKEVGVVIGPDTGPDAPLPDAPETA